MESRNWYCIYTKSHREDHVARYLSHKWGIETISPKFRKKQNINGTVTEVAEALFPCYIFSRFNPLKYYHMIKYTRGVRRVIGDESGNPRIVDGEVIEQIQSRVRDGFVQLESDDFDAGDNVVIRDGAFTGLSGIFIKDLPARDRVLILLSTLAYQARVEVEKGSLSRA